MPLYFFDVDQDGERLDREGIELADDKAAWAEALRTLNDSLGELSSPPSRETTCQVLVHCGAGNSVFTLQLVATAHRS